MAKRDWLAAACGVMCVLGWHAEICAGRTLYVAKSGNDLWSGTMAAVAADGQDGPFATVQRARDEIRTIRTNDPASTEPFVVEIGAGLYEHAEPLELSAQDSGSADAPVRYRAAPSAQVRLTGGRVLTDYRALDTKTVAVPVDEAAAAHIVVYDLKALGISEFGTPNGGWGQSNRDMAELFFRNQPMGMARWPNGAEMVSVAEPLGETPKIVRGTKGTAEGVFRYHGDRATRWLQERDVWCHGWWFWDWADQRQKITAIDPERKTISLAEPHHSYGYRKGQWYYVYNALSELDVPGEWCIDRENGLLYFWPPEAIGADDVVLSQARHIVVMNQCRQVILEGLLLDNTRNTAVVLNDCHGCRLVGCTIRNTGTNAVEITGGSDNGVLGCDMYNMGNGGIIMTGGDRKTLSKCGHFAENNHIHHYARWTRIVQPGLGMYGCGIRAAHNLIHDAPHNGILFSGNDHLMEYNEIHSVCYETNDAGAIYAGRDWTMGGTVIRHNYLHHISGFQGKGCVGIYLDDCFAQVDIIGNVFFEVTAAAFIGGGRNNLVENNLFLDCRPALHIDARGMGWAAASIPEVMTSRLKSMPIDSELWRGRFPYLQGILEDEPAAPKYNVVRNNYSWGGVWSRIEGKALPYQTLENNTVVPGPLATEVDFQMSAGLPHLPQAPALAPIPFAKIGLYESPQRASWPVLHQPRPRGTALVRQASAEEVREARPKPVHMAPRRAVAFTPDGLLAADEWPDLDPSRALLLAEGVDGERSEPRSTAWIFHDGVYLYVACDNAVASEPALRQEDKWGVNDAVELAFRKGSGQQSHIVIYRGFPKGQCLGSSEAGASDGQVQAAMAGVLYAAKVVRPGRWTAEWKIPLRNLGLDAAEPARLPFSMAVRKTANNQWLFWHGGKHSTWNVDETGTLTLEGK